MRTRAKSGLVLARFRLECFADFPVTGWPLAAAVVPIVPQNPLPSLAEIESASALIQASLPVTSCYSWPLINDRLGCEVWVKHENHQPIGAFKVRGGLVYLDELLKHEPDVRGVVAASTGNHGQSVAYAAKHRGLKAVIVIPQGNNPEKNQAMRSWGAELVNYGSEFQQALTHSYYLAGKEGMHALPSFHPWLVRGVATYALEWFRQAPALDTVFVPIGLGSGICGVAAARNALGLQTRIIGVVSEHAPAYALSFQQKRAISQTSRTQVGEGVACSTPDSMALAWILEQVADVVTVSDDEAISAIREILQMTHNLAEGAGVLGYAALRKNADAYRGQRVGIVLSGGNARTSVVAEALRFSIAGRG